MLYTFGRRRISTRFELYRSADGDRNGERAGEVRCRACDCNKFTTAAFVTVIFICLCAMNPLRAEAQQSGSIQGSAKEGASTQTAANPTASLAVNVRLVVLDVVATDQAGKPVEGLAAKDFQIFEDGQPQRIRSVEPPSVHSLPPAADATTANSVFDPAEPESFGQSPADILVLDQLNTPFADSAFARRCLHDYLASQPELLREPTTLVSVGENRFKQLQPFTRERDSLLRALDAATTEYAWTLETNGKAEHGPIIRLDQSLRALEEMAQNYARIPGRKNLVWVGAGFPTLDPETLGGSEMQEVRQTLQHVTDVLLDTHVTLYAIDPTSSAAGMAEITNASQMAFVQSAGDSLEGSADPFDSNEDFDKLGQVTGGRVVRGRNDVAGLIASSLDSGAHFYTLSYSPSSSSDQSAGYRKIRVVCLRAACTATTRSGYYSEKSQQSTSTASAAYDLTAAAESSTPLNGLRLSVERAPSAGASSFTYVIHVSADSLAWTIKPDGSASASVYILAASINAKNSVLDHIVRGMVANARPGTDLRGSRDTADFQFVVRPAPKSAVLRFVVRDSATGRMGLADIPLGGR